MADSWKLFTRKLFGDADADPGYYAVMFADLPEDQKKRIVVGWCAFYNLGLAAKLSEYKGAKFYTKLWEMFNEQPPVKRGSERRHFRGTQGRNAIAQWQEKFPKPEQMVDYILRPELHKPKYADIRARTNGVPMMGPYFAWKWGDLHEVLLGSPVDFTGAEKYSPPVPQEGAKLIFPDSSVVQAYADIVDYANSKDVTTPTNHDRAFDVQEAETVCCVYHQLLGGRYAYGSRTAKAIARLDEVKCDTALVMSEALLAESPYDRTYLRDVLRKL